ncbi:hypothetical protein NSPZN2_40649 [Nitrospira defluvii]|uniref:Secreted protein n=1 Tax=Nitrospira defluvii TaxID=330214 RepID=A0ABM8RYP8_9BACT|nr:hypothetical protein NSPZN2_40649 [Nitrospira defluvii]
MVVYKLLLAVTTNTFCRAITYAWLVGCFDFRMILLTFPCGGTHSFFPRESSGTVEVGPATIAA